MRDAYDDLRAHQFGVMVGMRAALERPRALHPAELKKMTPKSRARRLLPANRKAKLWDVFIELYGRSPPRRRTTSTSLFGKAFLQAYDERRSRSVEGRAR